MILIISANVIQSASAVFFTGEVLKDEDNVTVILVGDLHADFDPDLLPTQKQTDDLLKITKKYNAYLMVEDMPSYYVSQGKTFPSIKFSFELPRAKKRATLASPLANLCQQATKENIQNINIECRNEEQNLLPSAERIEKIKNFKDAKFQTYRQQFLEKKPSTEETQAGINLQFIWLELNTVYEFAQALQTKKYSLIIIAVGANHLRPISEMIQKIYNFKRVFQKNLYKYVEFFGSQEKNDELAEKKIIILNEYVLDLPQFFDEALKAPVIKSRL